MALQPLFHLFSGVSPSTLTFGTSVKRLGSCAQECERTSFCQVALSILATQMHASFRMSSRSVKKSYRSLAIFELARQSVKIFGPGRIQEDQASFRTPCGMI